MGEAWPCPRCSQVNAPWVPCCSCKVTYVGATNAPGIDPEAFSPGTAGQERRDEGPTSNGQDAKASQAEPHEEANTRTKGAEEAFNPSPEVRSNRRARAILDEFRRLRSVELTRAEAEEIMDLVESRVCAEGASSGETGIPHDPAECFACSAEVYFRRRWHGEHGEGSERVPVPGGAAPHAESRAVGEKAGRVPPAGEFEEQPLPFDPPVGERCLPDQGFHVPGCACIKDHAPSNLPFYGCSCAGCRAASDEVNRRADEEPPFPVMSDHLSEEDDGEPGDGPKDDAQTYYDLGILQERGEVVEVSPVPPSSGAVDPVTGQSPPPATEGARFLSDEERARYIAEARAVAEEIAGRHEVAEGEELPLSAEEREEIRSAVRARSDGEAGALGGLTIERGKEATVREASGKRYPWKDWVAAGRPAANLPEPMIHNPTTCPCGEDHSQAGARDVGGKRQCSRCGAWWRGPGGHECDQARGSETVPGCRCREWVESGRPDSWLPVCPDGEKHVAAFGFVPGTDPDPERGERERAFKEHAARVSAALASQGQAPPTGRPHPPYYHIPGGRCPCGEV